MQNRKRNGSHWLANLLYKYDGKRRFRKWLRLNKRNDAANERGDLAGPKNHSEDLSTQSVWAGCFQNGKLQGGRILFSEFCNEKTSKKKKWLQRLQDLRRFNNSVWTVESDEVHTLHYA